MKNLITFFSFIFLVSMMNTNGYSQGNPVDAMRFTHDFNVIGLKSEKDAAWVDELMKRFPDVITCHTDFSTGHTNAIVKEGINSIVYIKKIVKAAGFEIDEKSFTSKYEQQ